MAPKDNRLESSLQKLSLNSSFSPKKSRKPNPKLEPPSPVASWEEEAESSSSHSSSPNFSPPQTPTTALPLAPPSTPITSIPGPSGSRSNPRSPLHSTSSSFDWPTSPPLPCQFQSQSHSSPPTTRSLGVRPEKSTAVAGRMIAGALGMRAPVKSEETKKYEKSVRDKVEKEREDRRNEEEEREKAKRAVWED